LSGATKSALPRKSANFFLVLIGLGVGLSGGSSPAFAQESRTNGSKCFGNGGATNFNYYAADGYKNTRIISQGVYCPFVDDNSSVPRASVTAVTVHGDRPAAANSVTVSACVKLFGAVSFVCGPSVSTTATGQYALTLTDLGMPPTNLDTWNTQLGDFSYLLVDLSSLATVSGIWVR